MISPPVLSPVAVCEQSKSFCTLPALTRVAPLPCCSPVAPPFTSRAPSHHSLPHRFFTARVSPFLSQPLQLHFLHFHPKGPGLKAGAGVGSCPSLPLLSALSLSAEETGGGGGSGAASSCGLSRPQYAGRAHRSCCTSARQEGGREGAQVKGSNPAVPHAEASETPGLKGLTG